MSSPGSWTLWETSWGPSTRRCWSPWPTSRSSSWTQTSSRTSMVILTMIITTMAPPCCPTASVFCQLYNRSHLALRWLQLISGVLSTLPVLKELSITDNSLKWFDMAFFPKSLRVSFLRFSLFFVSQASQSFCRTGFAQDLNQIWTKIRFHEKIQSRAWKLLSVLMFAFHILFIMIYPRKRWKLIWIMMSNLKVINLRSNLIDVIGNYYKMLEDFNLVKLDLSDNRISILEPQIFVVSWILLPDPTLHIIINNKNLIFYRNPMQCWYWLVFVVWSWLYLHFQTFGDSVKQFSPSNIFRPLIFSCPEQLNRWPCPLVPWSESSQAYKVITHTCDLWDIWSEWRGDMTWPKKIYLPTLRNWL